MGRNKLIYAMSDFGLVVSAEHKKGDTWAGTEEDLKRENALPVFVRTGKDVPQGNSKLLDLGATPWPDSIDRKNFRQQLQDLAVNTQGNRPKMNQSLFDFQTTKKDAPIEDLPPATEVAKDKPKISEPEPVVETEVKVPESPASIYQAVLPVILNKLDNPATA